MRWIGAKNNIRPNLCLHWRKRASRLAINEEGALLTQRRTNQLKGRHTFTSAYREPPPQGEVGLGLGKNVRLVCFDLCIVSNAVPP